MRFKEDPDDPCEIQMGPLMDCVFLLLLYFISASQIKLEEKYLGLMMPGQALERPENLPAELTLSINESGHVYCNEQPMANPEDRELPLLRGKIKKCLDRKASCRERV